MSEVSLRAAYGAYRKYAESEELDELYRSIVRGQLEYVYTITHIYSFVDVMDDVQLFYVRKNEGLGDLKTSPHVKNLALVWEQPNEVHPAPEYLRRAFAEIKSGDEVIIPVDPGGAAQQIVGRERREHVSQLDWSGVA